MLVRVADAIGGDRVRARVGAHGAGGVRLARDRRDAERSTAGAVAVTDDALVDERRLAVGAGIDEAAITRGVVAAVGVRDARGLDDAGRLGDARGRRQGQGRGGGEGSDDGRRSGR
jgi:hypothetical protein